MGVLSRDEILANAESAVRVEPLEVKELGGTVYVREMLESEYQGEIAPYIGKEDQNLAARFATACLCDEDGTRLFKKGEFTMVAAKLSHKIAEKIARRAIEVNAVGSETLEELEGN